MKKISLLMLIIFLLTGCASHVKFIQTDESYIPQEKPEDAQIIFKHEKLNQPHKVIGVIVAELGKHARKPELDALIRKKALEVGADGVMLIQYDVDREVYLETHHKVVGRGPWKTHVVGTHPRVAVRKTVTAIAFKLKR